MVTLTSNFRIFNSSVSVDVGLKPKDKKNAILCFILYSKKFCPFREKKTEFASIEVHEGTEG